MNHGNPEEEETKGKFGLHTLRLAHIPLSPLRECISSQDYTLFKRETAGFWKYSPHFYHFQETWIISSESLSTCVVGKVHNPVTKAPHRISRWWVFSWNLGFKGDGIMLMPM